MKWESENLHFSLQLFFSHNDLILETSIHSNLPGKCQEAVSIHIVSPE